MCASVHILLVYFMTDQPPEAFRFFMFLSIGILMSLIGQSIGYAFGAALNLRVKHYWNHSIIEIRRYKFNPIKIRIL